MKQMSKSLKQILQEQMSMWGLRVDIFSLKLNEL